MDKTIIDISLRSILRVLAVLLAVLLVFAIRDLIILFLLAVVLASAISPVVNWLEEKGAPRILGLFSVIILILLTFSFLLYIVIPPFVSDMRVLSQNLPAYEQSVIKLIRPLNLSLNGGLSQELNRVLPGITTFLGQSVSSLPSTAFHIFGGLFKFAALLLVTFYLALERDGVAKFLKAALPKGEDSYAFGLWRRAQKKIGSWAQGQFLLMFIIGLATFIGLSLLNVPYALLLAMVAGVFDLVPVVGTIIAGGLAFIVALFQSPELAVLVVVFYFVLHEVEAHILVPLLYKRILRIHPILVIFALMVGAELWGFMGIILAVPIAAVVAEFLQDLSSGKVGRF